MPEESYEPQEDLESASRAVKTSTEQVPRIVQYTGTAVEYTGKAIRAAGTGLQAAGAGISTLAVIPYVGVVFGSIGKGLQAAGKGINAAGKGVEAAGKGMKGLGKGLGKVKSIAGGVGSLAKGGPVGFLASLASKFIPYFEKVKKFLRKAIIAGTAYGFYLLLKALWPFIKIALLLAKYVVPVVKFLAPVVGPAAKFIYATQIAPAIKILTPLAKIAAPVVVPVAKFFAPAIVPAAKLFYATQIAPAVKAFTLAGKAAAPYVEPVGKAAAPYVEPAAKAFYATQIKPWVVFTDKVVIPLAKFLATPAQFLATKVLFPLAKFAYPVLKSIPPFSQFYQTKFFLTKVTPPVAKVTAPYVTPVAKAWYATQIQPYIFFATKIVAPIANFLAPAVVPTAKILAATAKFLYNPYPSIAKGLSYTKSTFNTVTAGPIQVSGGIPGAAANAVSWVGVNLTSAASTIWGGITGVGGGLISGAAGLSSTVFGGLTGAASTIGGGFLGAAVGGAVGGVATLGIITGSIIPGTGFFTSKIDAIIGSPGSKPPTTTTGGVSVLMVGDSIMLSAQDQLKNLGDVEVNAEVGRQFSEGVDILTARKNAGTLKDYIVVHLGTNGYIGEEQHNQMMLQLSGVQKVIFVNIKADREWEQPNNDLLAAKLVPYTNTALADWYGTSISHTEYFQPDGIHLTATGIQAYVNLISGFIPKVNPSCPNGWPTDHGTMTQGPAGPTSHNSLLPGGEEAIDIGLPLTEGDPAYATFDGNVVFMDPDGGGGYGVYVDIAAKCDGITFRARYAHLVPGSIPASFSQSSKVTRGERVGYIDTTGTNIGGAHLHYSFFNLPMTTPYIPTTPNPKHCEEGTGSPCNISW